MRCTILPTYQNCCARVADELAQLLAMKPDALLCLAAGHSSLGVFDAMVDLQQSGRADFSRVHIVGLDEWTGMARADDGSCAGFLHKNCFQRLPIARENIHLFDGRYRDGKAECQAAEDFIQACGGIDFMLLGIGMNGHLALNEPGTSFALGAHETMLSETTRRVGQKYFARETELTRGVTLGIRNILASRRIVLMVNGSHKREVFAKLMAAEVGTDFPASVLKTAAQAEIVAEAICAD